jgi:hypothetical protein
MTMIYSRKLPSQYGSASVLGIAMGLIGFVALGKVVWESPLPYAMKHYGQHVTGWLSLRLNQLAPEVLPDIAQRYSHYLDQLPPDVPSWALTGRFDTVALLSLALAAGLTWLIGKGKPDTRTIAGRVLYQGRKARRELRRHSKEKCQVSGQGLKLHPSFDWTLSLDQETRHLLVQGGVGSGKTQILWSLINAAIARGDKLVMYDNKGDFTAQLPEPLTLLAPWDARSFAWDIAKDCSNGQDARELSARLIPDGHDPMWHSAARMILTAVLCKLQAEQPKSWTWADLYRLACGDQEQLLAIVTKYQPEAVNILAGESKTTDGILINLSASLAIVADLAQAWGSAPPEKRFAFSEWIQNPNPASKVVILQGNGRYAELTKGYVQGIIAMLAGRINSSEVGESKERRVWLVLDEVPQLGKIPGLSSILEVGRSKGIRVVLGTQDLSQLQEIYGQYVGRIWGSLVGTQIIVRTSSGDTANFISKEMIGYATVEKTLVHEGKAQPSQTMQQLVMEPSDLADQLGTDDKGVKGVLLGMGDAYLLHWPYTTMPKRREASVPAAWISGAVHSVMPPTMAATGIDTVPTVATTSKQATAPAGTERPRLKLRPPTPEEIREMAESGSDIREANESIDDMEPGELEIPVDDRKGDDV